MTSSSRPRAAGTPESGDPTGWRSTSAPARAATHGDQHLGRALTQLSLWWFDQLADLVPNHVISTELPAGAPADWAGRTLICHNLDM
ncbi:hypothetical protein ACFXNY_33040, partial [Streptomyces sindenensis]